MLARFSVAVLAITAICGGTAQAQTPPVADLIIEGCSPCHGDAGIAKSVDVPNLAGQHNAYLYNQLRAFRAGKRPHKDMLYMSRQLTEQEMRMIADYYARLPPR